MRLAVVTNVIEAEVLCGLLRTNGIRCAQRKTDVSASIDTYGGGLAIGGVEVLVDEQDLEAANALLPPG